LNDDSRRFELKSDEARGSVFAFRRRHSSNAEPSNIIENNLVAPLDERDRGIVARLQEEIGRFNRELEGRQKSRDELKKLLPE